MRVACGEGSYFCNFFDLPSEKKGIVRRKLFGRDVFHTLDADPEGEVQEPEKECSGADVFENRVSAEVFPVTRQ